MTDARPHGSLEGVGGSRRETVYLGLGSNVGDRPGNLSGALARLAELGRLTGLSGVYETDPVGFEDQPPFLNLVARLETALEPVELMETIRTIERDLGRVRMFRNAPRSLDIDILVHGEGRVEREGLRVPHPRMTERAFVLVPLLELEPDLVEPETGRPYADYLFAERGASGPGDGHRRVQRIMDGEELLHDDPA